MKNEQQRIDELKTKSLKELTEIYNDIAERKINNFKCSKIVACKRIIAKEIARDSFEEDSTPSTVPGKTIHQVKNEIDTMVEKALVEIKKKDKNNIGNLCRSMILDGKTREEIINVVKQQFPNARTNNAHIAWYKSKMRKQGLIA